MTAAMREAAALSPCPFCGGKAEYEHLETGTWSVGCEDADGKCFGYQSVQTFARKCEAREGWNRRAIPVAQADELICTKCKEVRERSSEAVERVLIWSGEHQAYWRPDSAGYVRDGLGAGLYDRVEAERILAGVGPEKKLELRSIDPSWPILAALSALPRAQIEADRTCKVCLQVEAEVVERCAKIAGTFVDRDITDPGHKLISETARAIMVAIRRSAPPVRHPDRETARG